MPEAGVQEVLLAVSATQKASRARSIDWFRKCDKSGDGTLTGDELRGHLIAALGAEMTDESFTDLMGRLDRDKSGEVTLKEFDRALKQAERETLQTDDAELKTPVRPRRAPSAPEAPRPPFSERAPRRRPRPPPAKVESTVASHGVSGAPSPPEASAEASASAEISLSSPAAPSRARPRLRLQNLLGKQERLEPIDASDEALMRMKGHLNKLKTRLIDLHRTFDADGGGSLSIDEFRDGVTKLGIHMSSNEFDALVAGVDRDGNGDISVKEFHAALKLAERKARAEGRGAEVDTWWATAPSRESLGVESRYDWSRRSVAGGGFAGYSLASTGSSWISAASGPLQHALSARLHCGSVKDASVSRQRLFDGQTPCPPSSMMETPDLPLYRSIYQQRVFEGRFGRVPVILPDAHVVDSAFRCAQSSRKLRPLTFENGVKKFQNSPMMQSTVDQVVFGRDMDMSGETKYDPEFTSMFDGCAGLPTWHFGR